MKDVLIPEQSEPVYDNLVSNLTEQMQSAIAQATEIHNKINRSQNLSAEEHEILSDQLAEKQTEIGNLGADIERTKKLMN